MKIASPSEMSLMCRLCLMKDKKQVNISIFEDRSDNKLLVKISALLPIKVSKEDQLPKKICNECSNKLNFLYAFRNTALESEQTLLSWFNDDNLTINPLAETVVKEEVEVDEESLHLDLLQYSPSNKFRKAEEEETEEPLVKRPRQSDAIKSEIHIAPESDENNDEDEPDTVDVEIVANLGYESCENDNNEDIEKLENDFSSSDPEKRAYDQPGPSDLGKSEAEKPFMINEYLQDGIENEMELTAFKCDTCKKKFQKRYDLNRHILTHSDEKNFKCNICNSKFKEKSNLKRHSLIHSNFYPFECDICKSKFKRKNDLKIHKLTHSDIYPFECDICKAKFKKKGNLQGHISTAHSNIYPFECEICKAKFKKKEYLKTHKLTHSDIYPFKCDKCKSKFKRKDHLKSHKLTHSNIYPFECDTCKAKFKLKYSLKKHLLTHSNESNF